MIPELSSRSRATMLLVTADSGGGSGLERLVPLLYDELRAMAHRQLGRERRHSTLQTTALVHEAYLKLVDDTKVTSRGRAYFFAAAARAMRQVLIDQARRRNAEKRGGGVQALSLDEELIAVDEFAVELMDLDRALEQLAALNPRHARVVECRYFAGMSVEETAAALDVSPRTVKYDWALARAWLYDALGGGHDPGEAPA
jgi:RNA polymerase sigma-70 factor, ECF subfamily